METDVLPRPVHTDAGPVLAPATELLGLWQDSAFENPRYLVRRGDGQVMQLPELLYRVASALDGRPVDDVAAHLRSELGNELTGEQVAFLVDDRLRPVGIIDDARASAAGRPEQNPPQLVRSDPLLGLRHRVGVIPASAAWRLAGVFGWLFRRPAWIVSLAAFLAVDVAVLLRGDLLGTVAAGITSVIETPALVLVVIALTAVSGAFHECGHIAACRYGGARPGDVGVGLYLIWPTLYSTVTDSYRLDRVGRLRTDLGGVYFDAIFLAGLGALYLRTGEPWLFVALIGLHGEAASQFLPSLRLDGYYILADLIGVPDLFGYVKPVLLSALPGRAADPKVLELKPRAWRIVVLWVALVVPTLAISLVLLVLALPTLLPVAWAAALDYVDGLGAAVRGGDVLTSSLAVLQLFLLVLPWAGGVLGIWTVAGLLRRRLAQRRGGDGSAGRGGPSRVGQLTCRAVGPAILIALAAAVVVRVGQVAQTMAATVGETRLSLGALTELRGGSPPPAHGLGEQIVREHLVLYARLTGSFDRTTSVVTAGRGLAVLATGVLVCVLLAMVASGLRMWAAALALLTVLVVGPAVTTLSTLGPAVVGVAWCAVGAMVLAAASRRVARVLGLVAVGVGVAIEPLLLAPLAAGVVVAALLPARPGTGRHAGSNVGPRPRPWVRPAVMAAALAAVLLLALTVHTDPAPARPGGSVLLLLGAVIAAAGLLVRSLRPLAAAAVAALAVAAPPLDASGGPVLVLVTLVLVGVLLIDTTARTPATDRPNPMLRALAVVPVLVFVAVGVLFVPGTMG